MHSKVTYSIHFLLQFLNDNTSQKTGRFVVPADFDRTPTPRLSADNYMISADIVKLIKTIYIAPTSGTDTDWTQWFDWIGANEAKKFFAGPQYPVIASMQLGYPQEEDDDALFPEDE